MPALFASRSTASVKPRLSIRCTNLMTSPPSEQEKQYQRPRLGVTLNEGVFSSWNGHSPLSASPPALRSCRYSPTTSAMGERSRTVPTSSSRIRPATYAPSPHACAVAASLVLPTDTHGVLHRWYLRRVRGHLVLWDIDNTLI